MDYAGFLSIACNKDKKGDLQVLQNDALRFCSKNAHTDKILLVELHKKANLASLEQRRCMQLLSLMYKLSKIESNRKIGARNTRQRTKFEFIVDNKIGTKYANSPFYKGCKLWDKLTKDIQLSDSHALFKQVIKPAYKVFDDAFVV